MVEFIIRNIQLDEVHICLNLSIELNPNVTPLKFSERIQEMYKNGFQFIGIFSSVNNHLAGISGYWINTKMYSGKYLEIDNFIISSEFRNQKLGEKVANYLEELALKEGCNFIMLDSYIVNEPSHRFYERLGYVKKGFHFLKKCFQD